MHLMNAAAEGLFRGLTALLSCRQQLCCARRLISCPVLLLQVCACMLTQHKAQLDARDKNPGMVRPAANPYAVSLITAVLVCWLPRSRSCPHGLRFVLDLHCPWPAVLDRRYAATGPARRRCNVRSLLPLPCDRSCCLGRRKMTHSRTVCAAAAATGDERSAAWLRCAAAAEHGRLPPAGLPAA